MKRSPLNLSEELNRMKRKSNLSEELYKMRKLMGYDSKEDSDNVTSLDRLVEEKMVEKYLLSEQTYIDQLQRGVDNANQKRAQSQKDRIRATQAGIDAVGSDYTTQKQNAKRDCVKNFLNYFWVLPKYERTKLFDKNIDAPFWNNMVTLEKGLMNGPDAVRQQIQDIITKINDKDVKPENVEIKIIGTASGAGASSKPDVRLLKKFGKDYPLDHNYGGGDPDNDYLARSRANSIEKEFKKYLPNAKYYPSEWKIIGDTEETAGSKGDPFRYIKVEVNGIVDTQDQETKDSSYLNWEYNYVEGEGYTTWQAFQDTAGVENSANAMGATTKGGPFKTYTAKLTISFGSGNPVFGGTFVKGSADNDLGGEGVEGVTVYKHSLIPSGGKKPTSKSDSMWKSMTISSNPNGWIDIQTQTLDVRNKLRSFLTSSGHFNSGQVDKILKGFDDPNSQLLNSMKGQKGNLTDFIKLTGGEPNVTLTGEYAKGAYIDNTIKKSVSKIQ